MKIPEVLSTIQEKVGDSFLVTATSFTLGQWSPIGSHRVLVKPVSNDVAGENNYEVEFGELSDISVNQSDGFRLSVNESMVPSKPAAKKPAKSKAE